MSDDLQKPRDLHSFRHPLSLISYNQYPPSHFEIVFICFKKSIPHPADEHPEESLLSSGLHVMELPTSRSSPNSVINIVLLLHEGRAVSVGLLKRADFIWVLREVYIGFNGFTLLWVFWFDLIFLMLLYFTMFYCLYAALRRPVGQERWGIKSNT